VLYAEIKRGDFVPEKDNNMACRCEAKKVVPEKKTVKKAVSKKKKK